MQMGRKFQLTEKGIPFVSIVLKLKFRAGRVKET